MSTGYILQHIEKTDLMFEILAFDTTTKRATLKGSETGVEFTEVLTKEFLKQFKYKVVKQGDGHA